MIFGWFLSKKKWFCRASVYVGTRRCLDVTRRKGIFSPMEMGIYSMLLNTKTADRAPHKGCGYKSQVTSWIHQDEMGYGKQEFDKASGYVEATHLVGGLPNNTGLSGTRELGSYHCPTRAMDQYHNMYITCIFMYNSVYIYICIYIYVQARISFVFKDW